MIVLSVSSFGVFFFSSSFLWILVVFFSSFLFVYVCVCVFFVVFFVDFCVDLFFLFLFFVLVRRVEGTLHGVFNSVAGVGGAVNDTVSLLTFDDDYRSKRERQKNKAMAEQGGVGQGLAQVTG